MVVHRPRRIPGSIAARLWLQTARARRAWAIGIGLVVTALTALYQSIADSRALTDALEGYPEAMRKMFGLDAFTTGPG